MRWYRRGVGATARAGATALCAAVAALVLAAPSGAQQVDELDLPESVADEIVAFFNAPTTTRFRGAADIAAGRTVEGDVAVLEGPLVIAGRVDGDVVVVNGDVIIEPGGRVEGDVTVLGGRATAPAGTVGGRLAIFDEALAYTRRGDRIEYDDRRGRRSRRWDYDGPSTRSRISVRVEDSYNRVEGLPLRIGPVFETRGRNFLRLDALGVLRTDRGLSLDDGDLGYFARIEQHFGRDGRFSLGGTAHSLITPIERWGLTDIEATLATLLFHRDYRDYYEREGWSAFARYQDRFAGVQLTAEFRDEEHLFAPVGTPWTLRRGDEAWRPQPLVGEGSLRTVSGELIIDDRNDPEDPTDGWFLEARATAGIEGSLTHPIFSDPVRADDLRTGFLDLRRYARLGPLSDVRVRGLFAGSLNDGPLPPQFQHALGGEGSLPGYRPFSLDCGARSRAVQAARGRDGERVTAFPAYGCDRIALFQFEYRGGFSIDFDLGGQDDDWDEDWNDWEWYPVIDVEPRWALFFNAGQGWALGQDDGPFARSDTGRFADVGAGFFLGDVGLYWAYPLNGDDRGVNFFLRIDHRF